jgi:hypothetical protein
MGLRMDAHFMIIGARREIRMESPQLSVIKIWAALAWADGVVAPAEAAALERLIGASDLSDADKDRARAFLNKKVDLGEVKLEGLSSDGREGIYRAALRLSTIDGVLADSETALLGRLRDKLAIPEPRAREIQASLPAARK